MNLMVRFKDKIPLSDSSHGCDSDEPEMRLSFLLLFNYWYCIDIVS
jgi:hypothetical protein